MKNILLYLLLILFASFILQSHAALTTDQANTLLEQAKTDSNSLRTLKNEAEHGDKYAQLSLGIIYDNGWNVKQDYVLAVNWYRKAAIQGLADAQNNLGSMCRNGQGMQQDYIQAVNWYQKSAEQGLADAQYNLGVMYYKGLGTAQNYTQASSWFRKAAEQGYARAQVNLAHMYANGQGVPKSLVVAYALNNVLAADNEKAMNNRLEITEIMSQREIKAGQTLTRKMQENGNFFAEVDAYITK